MAPLLEVAMRGLFLYSPSFLTLLLLCVHQEAPPIKFQPGLLPPGQRSQYGVRVGRHLWGLWTRARWWRLPLHGVRLPGDLRSRLLNTCRSFGQSFVASLTSSLFLSSWFCLHLSEPLPTRNNPKQRVLFRHTHTFDILPVLKFYGSWFVFLLICVNTNLRFLENVEVVMAVTPLRTLWISQSTKTAPTSASPMPSPCALCL